MTRRSLSPVPDAPRGGIDIAEACRNLAPAAPAPLHAVQAAADTEAAAEARKRLQRLQEARRIAIGELSALDQNIDRAGRASSHAQDAQREIARLEQTVTDRVSAWVRSGAEGTMPEITPEERQALDNARRRATEAAQQTAAINQALPALEQKRQRLADAIRHADAEIRDAAVHVVCAEARPYLQQLREQRLAIRALELRLLGLREQLGEWGLGVSPEAYALVEAFPVTPATVPAPTEADRFEWVNQFNDLVAGEEK